MIGALINPSGFARVSELRSLGVPFAVSTTWQKVSKKQFPAPVKIGHITVWKVADVLAWLDEQAKPAPTDIESRGAKLTAARLAKRQRQAAAVAHDPACAHVCNLARGAA